MTDVKDINDWTREEFEKLPSRIWQEDVGEFDYLIILPASVETEPHDSGFRCMDFIAVVKGEPKCRLSGCSDVIHLDGIGGWGYRWLEKYGDIPKKVSPSGWSMDCLRTSGLLRLFPSRDHYGKMRVGPALSSFEVFTSSPKRAE